MRMTRILTVLLLSGAALVFATSASAYIADRGTAGNGSQLSLDKGKGLAVVTSSEGSMRVHINQGSITFVDYPRGAPTTFTPFKKWGCEKKRRPNRKTFICSGKNLNLWIVDGAWLATLRGKGISASASVTGKVMIRGTRGTFSIDTLNIVKRKWPSPAQTFKLG